MSEQFAIAIMKVLGAGVFGFLIAYFTLRAQTKKKIVEIKRRYIELVRIKTGEGRLFKLIVEKDLISGNKEDSGKPYEVDNAFGHLISIKNIGNDVMEDFIVCIKTSEGSKIIKANTTPAQGEGYSIDISQAVPSNNEITLRFPYLNPKENIEIVIISTDNLKPSDCVVEVKGKGIRVIKYSLIRLGLIIFSLLISSFILAYIFENIIPNYLYKIINVHRSTKEVIILPLWYKIPSIGIAITPIITGLYLFIAKFEPRME